MGGPSVRFFEDRSKCACGLKSSFYVELLLGVEEAGRATRGVLVCRVPERHKCGHRDIVIRETASHGQCIFYDCCPPNVSMWKEQLVRKKMFGGFFL